MAFAFRYPVTGGTGASSGSDLVTACGTFDPFSSGGTVSIWGKIYPASSPPTDLTPPSGSSPGTIPPGSDVWHFNSCSPPLSGCGTSGSFIMRVWLTSTSIGHYLIRDCAFTGCVSGSGNCVPDCPASAPQPPDGTDSGPVIAEAASRYFIVVPSPSLLKVLDVFGSGIDPAKLKMLLAYDEVRSTFNRAIWVSSVVRGDQLRLEVSPGGCCNRAFLARVRVAKQQVFTLERWASECFDVVQGGPMHALSASGEWCEGGVILKPPPSTNLTAPPMAAEKAPTPVKKASRRRGRR
jgi:hypothetical protein